MERNFSAAGGISAGVASAVRAELDKRKRQPSVILLDVFSFGVAFIFARWHFIFGAYPLAVALVASAHAEVWLFLIGAVLGSLSLGSSGVINAMICLVVVFLRVLISGGESKGGEGRVMFSEPLLLRLAASLIGAFIASVYELLLGGVSSAALLYSLSSCASALAFCAVFWGMFSSGIGFFDVVFGRTPIFERKRQGREKYKMLLFEFSALVFIFMVSLAAKQYSLFGINLDFVFSGVVTLFAARRFGAVKAVAVGFISSLGVSSTYSVAFALLGLGAGLLFPLGHVYAFLGGGALLSVWSAYTGGLVGFLSTLPEYAAAIAVFFPFVKFLGAERREEEREDTRRIASDMVSATALSHKNERGTGAEQLSSSVAAAAALVARFGKNESVLSEEDVHDFLLEGLRSSCAECPSHERCKEINPAPCLEILDKLTIKVYSDGRISSLNTRLLPEYCENSVYLISSLSSSFAAFSMEKYKAKNLTELAEEYELMAKLINEVTLSEAREDAQDKPLGEALETALVDAGLGGGVIRAYGERRRRIIAAGVDEDGSLISSKSFFDGIYKISGLPVGTPEFYRKGSVALMDAPLAPIYAVEYAKSSLTAEGSPRSGDSSLSFSTRENYFYSLLSDGMGTGELAGASSLFAAEFLESMLAASASEATSIRMLNHIVRRRGEECSVTLDLFRLDLFSGEAVFFKSGAVASYVKREDSLFKIRSESAPLGILRAVDAEKIRVECRVGDIVIMLSDGIGDSPEVAHFLAELLTKPAPEEMSDYASAILEAALAHGGANDDMTVSVIKIKKRLC